MCLKSNNKKDISQSLITAYKGVPPPHSISRSDAQKFFRKASDENHVERTYTGATWNLYISTSPYIDHQLRSEASFLFSSLCLPCDESLRFGLWKKSFSILSISIFKDLIFVELERKFQGICVLPLLSVFFLESRWFSRKMSGVNPNVLCLIFEF